MAGCAATCLVRHQHPCRDVHKRAQHQDAQDAEQSCDERVDVVAAGEPGAYSRQQAAYPAKWLREHKFWPPVGRIDNVFGDRNPVCACPPVEAYVS